MTMSIGGTSGLVFPDSSTQNTAATGFGFKNRIINGAMMIDQRNAGASVTPANNQYSVDRWQFQGSQASKLTMQQNAGSVTPPAGFVNYLGVTSASAYSVLNSDYFLLRQAIEGLNVADLGWGTANAQSVTLSFKVYSSLTGTFGGSLSNNGDTRCYPFSFSIPVANTWTSASITIAGDTSGTWLKTNATGINLYFSMGTGSTYLGAAGSWAGTAYYGATGQTNLVGTNGATFYITGVQLEKGSTATSFDYRPYGTELALCHRYCYIFQPPPNTNTFIPATVYGAATLLLYKESVPVAMRATPSATTTVNPTATYAFYTYSGTTGGVQVPTAFSVNARGGSPLQLEVVLTGASNWGGTYSTGSLTVTGSTAGTVVLSAEL